MFVPITHGCVLWEAEKAIGQQFQVERIRKASSLCWSIPETLWKHIKLYEPQKESLSIHSVKGEKVSKETFHYEMGLFKS